MINFLFPKQDRNVTLPYSLTGDDGIFGLFNLTLGCNQVIIYSLFFILYSLFFILYSLFFSLFDFEVFFFFAIFFFIFFFFKKVLSFLNLDFFFKKIICQMILEQEEKEGFKYDRSLNIFFSSFSFF